MNRVPDRWNWLKPWVTLPLIALNAWVVLQLFHYFEPIGTVMVIASVLAFILNYPVQVLQKRRIGRGYAVLIVLLVALVALMALGVTLLPVLLEELNEIVTLFPSWLNSVTQKLQQVQAWASSHRLPINLNRWLDQFGDRLPENLESFADETVLLTLDAVGRLTTIFLTLVLTLYLLLDGRRVWDGVLDRLPITNRDRLRRLLQLNFQRYFIGQLTLGLMMGVIFSLTFFVLQVPYSLLLGSLVGLATLVPFGDTIAFLSIGLLLATQNPALAVRTLLVSIVLDQIIDQAITPRILGGFTGLKPVWVLLSLLFGTKIVGVAGLLTAVPLAGAVQDLLDGTEAEAMEPTIAPKATADSPTADPAIVPIVQPISTSQL